MTGAARAIPGAADEPPGGVRAVSGEHRLSERMDELGPWEDLYRAHADFVWRCLMRMGLGSAEAEDALHDVFLVAVRRKDTYDSALGSHRNWLFGIAANIVRHQLRTRHRFVADDTSEGGEVRSMDGVRAVERESLRVAIERAIAELDPDKRAVFCMFELEGLGCGAIATELDVPVGTIYSRLSAARAALQSLLADFRPDARGER